MSTKSTSAKSANKATTTSNNAKKATKKATSTTTKKAENQKAATPEKVILTASTFAAYAAENGGTLAAIVAGVEKYTLEISAESTAAVIAGLFSEDTSMTAIKAAQKAINTFTGGRFAEIKKAVQAARVEAVTNDLNTCKDVTMSYNNLLSLAFADLSKNPSFAALCSYAQSTFDNAAELVRAYYPAIDATTGAPLTVAAYIDADNKHVCSYYALKPLTATTAVTVTIAALNNLAKCGKARVKGDGWKWQNSHVPGTLAAVNETKKADDGTMTKGAKVAAVADFPAAIEAAEAAGYKPLADVNKSIKAGK